MIKFPDVKEKKEKVKKYRNQVRYYVSNNLYNVNSKIETNKQLACKWMNMKLYTIVRILYN